MRLENAVAADVLDRILSAYGFVMQKELSDKLGIARSNVASWLARGQVPGNVIVQCSLDTGADVKWLVTGELANTSHGGITRQLSGKPLYDEVMRNGGKLVLQRILNAYGFTMQKQLCELLGISSGTVSTWVRRGYFPGDVVVTCALDTGVPLNWLATGKGEKLNFNNSNTHAMSIPCKNLIAGILHEAGSWVIDLNFLPHNFSKPMLISSITKAWIIDSGITEISNGRWLLDINGKCDVYDISLLPGGRVNVKRKEDFFCCGTNECNAVAKVILTIDYN